MKFSKLLMITLCFTTFAPKSRAANQRLDSGEKAMIAASAANMYNCAVSIYAQYVPVAEGERITDENLNSAIVKVGCNHEAEITFPEMSFPQADATKGEILAVLGGAGLKLKGQCMSVAVNGKYSQNCFVVRGE